jgi:hypothetical protein
MSFGRVNCSWSSPAQWFLVSNLAGLHDLILPSDTSRDTHLVETVLTVRQISFLFGIQQATMLYRTTIGFVSKVTRSRSIIRENMSNIFIPIFFSPWLLLPFASSLSLFLALSLQFLLCVCPTPYRSSLSPRDLPSRRHSALSRVAVKQLTIRADSIRQGQHQNTSCVCEAMWGLSGNLRAHMTGSDPTGTWAHTQSRCWNVVHWSVVSLNDWICTLASNVDILVNN